MRKAGLIASIVLGAAWPGAAPGEVIVSLNNPGSTTLHGVEVPPGATFTVDVNIETDSSLLYALDLVVQSSAIDVFQIIDRSNRPPWVEGDGGIGPMDPASTRAGWGLPDPEYFGPGASTLGTLTLAVAPTAPQLTYTINAADIRVYEGRFIPGYGGGAPDEDFVVHVTPEPASLIMLVVLGLPLSRRRP